MAEKFHKTPYELVTDHYTAFGFNRNIYIFGRNVDNLLEETESYEEGELTKFKRKYTLNQAIAKASENPNDPKNKFQGYAQLFAGLG